MMKTAFRRIIPLLLLFSLLGISLPSAGYAATDKIFVAGAVETPLVISLEDLQRMISFHANKVVLLGDKKRCKDEESFISMADYKGVLLRDILEQAGMKYRRKWEPGVYVVVRGAEEGLVTFSFGEIFYSSIGRSILIAYERNRKPIRFTRGCGELLVTTDLRDGRRIQGVKEIIVKRVDIEMNVYEERAGNIVRPPTEELVLVDRDKGKEEEITLQNLKALPSVYHRAAAMVGDCEGFHGVYSFEGPLLRVLLSEMGIKGCNAAYDHFVVVSSANGFCATFSFGELFNSRLGNNCIIAFKKDGALLGPEDGFARSVAEEDGMGGRSVRRIARIEILKPNTSFERANDSALEKTGCNNTEGGSRR